MESPCLDQPINAFTRLLLHQAPVIHTPKALLAVTCRLGELTHARGEGGGGTASLKVGTHCQTTAPAF